MAKASEAPEIVEVTDTFFCPLGTFAVGTLYRSDDPVVKKYPAHFRAVTVLSTQRAAPVVEQATAAPGEKRGA